MLRELPPTAGLPLLPGDFLPFAARPLDKELAKFLSGSAVQIESSGSAALVIALSALKGLSKRKSVVIPAFTCPLVALAIAQCGLKIQLCDVAPDSFDFDMTKLSAVCDADTLCIISTHTGGLAADVESALDIGRKAGAYVLEDAAQALGASCRGKPLGTLGDIGMFSLTRGKGLTIYEGGFLVAATKDLQDAIATTGRRLRRRQLVVELLRFIELVGYLLFYNPAGLTVAYGLPLRHWLKRQNLLKAVGEDFPAEISLQEVGWLRRAVGSRALSRLAAALTDNRQRALRRVAALAEIEGISVVGEQEGSQGAWPFIMVLFDNPASCRKALEALWTSGLGVTKLFLHDLTGYDYLKEIVQSDPCPNAASFAERCLTISNSAWVTDADFEQITAAIAMAVSASHSACN